MAGGGRLPGLAVVLVALAANAWMLALDFQGDDFDLIPDAGWMAGLESPPQPDRAVATRTYSFRPTLWIVLHGIVKLWGGRAAPLPLHAFFWAAHALAAWALWRLVRSRCGDVAGFVSGCLFAILPGGIQAASWISAGGDQLAVLFVLLGGLASDHAFRKGSIAGVLLCGASSFFAVCSKETAIVLVPALAILWIFPPAAAPRRRIAGLAVSVLAGMAAAWMARAFAMMTFAPNYSIATRFTPAHLPVLPGALRGLLAPWSPGPAGEATPPSVALMRSMGLADPAILGVLAALAATAAVLPLLRGLVRGSWRHRLAMAMLAALLVAVTLPVLPMISRDGFGMARARYPASLAYAALVGASLTGATPRDRWALAATVPIFLLSIDGLVFAARVELDAAAVVRRATRDFRAIVAERPDTRVLLLAPPPFLGGVPFLTAGFAKVVSPPFGDVRERPLVWLKADTLDRFPALTHEPAPIQLAEWDGRRIARRGPELPAIPPELPALDGGREGAPGFRPAGVTPCRAVVGVAFEPSGERPAGAAGTVTWSAGDQVRRVRFDASGNGPRVVGIPDDQRDARWVTTPALDSVRVEGVDLAAPPVLLRAVPPIELLEPAAHTRLDLMAPPRVAFRPAAGAAAYRLTVEFVILDARLPLSWIAQASDLAPDVRGGLVMVADRPVRVPTEDGWQLLDWNALSERYFLRYADPRFPLTVQLQVEGLDALGENAVARSEWVEVTMARR